MTEETKTSPQAKAKRRRPLHEEAVSKYMKILAADQMVLLHDRQQLLAEDRELSTRYINGTLGEAMTGETADDEDPGIIVADDITIYSHSPQTTNDNPAPASPGIPVVQAASTASKLLPLALAAGSALAGGGAGAALTKFLTPTPPAVVDTDTDTATTIRFED